MFSLRW